MNIGTRALKFIASEENTYSYAFQTGLVCSTFSRIKLIMIRSQSSTDNPSLEGGFSLTLLSFNFGCV
jgi:hypothetical protein